MLTIKTNHHFRDIISWYDLTDKEKEDFDYIKDECGSFFRYQGIAYALAEFTHWDNPESPTRGEWDGFRSDSFFSGVVVKFSEDCEEVKVGLAMS